MPLSITLKPNERIVVNGCEIRNSNRRHKLHIESQADVIREGDLLDKSTVATPVKRTYFLLQTALIHASHRESLVPLIQSDLADLAMVFGGDNLSRVFEAANFVSHQDFYKALSSLRPVMKHEEALLQMLAGQQSETADQPPSVVAAE